MRSVAWSRATTARTVAAALAAWVASGLEAADTSGSDLASSGLALEDICQGATDSEQCSLSLRQLRGTQQSVALDPVWGELGGTGPTGNLSVAEADYKPFNQALDSPSSAPVQTFYMYRVTNGKEYPPLNVNTGNIAGVLWYLHHEVVVQYPRKFGIAKILRYKVRTKATKPLWDKGMHFGVRMAFDKGEATGPFVCGRDWGNSTDTSSGMPKPKFCNGPWQESYNVTSINGKTYSSPFEWSQYGFFVGCNNLGEFPFPTYPVAYPDARWYSLPGACPEMAYYDKTEACEASQPGGFCGVGKMPTGQGDCTWSYELAGEISINELVGISKWDWPHFREWGHKEYDPFTDEGTHFDWWNGIDNATANQQRIDEAQRLFTRKYPDQTADEDMPSPPCDFNFHKFYHEFFMRNPHTEDNTPCEEAPPDSACQKDIRWAKSDGIYAHPEWYEGLSPSSSSKDFQKVFWMQGLSGCPKPCAS